MDTAREGALNLLNMGLKVFPLQPGGKKPAIQGWQEWAIHSDIEMVTTYSDHNPDCNWGVFCSGSGLAVIDIDKKDDVNGYQSLHELQKRHGALEPTLSINTPSGGCHYYFKGDIKNSASVLGVGIDTRGEGGYVVAPGSVIGDKAYTILNNSDIAKLPNWIHIGKTDKNPIVLPEGQDVYNSIPEGKRNDMLTSWAGLARSKGLIEPELRSLLEGINNVRCSDNPLPSTELDAIASSIGGKTRQVAQAIHDFSTNVDPKELKSQDDWPYDLDFFTNGTAPERDWIIPDWIPKGEMGSLYGSGSSGKSLLSLQLGLSLVTETDFLGLPVAHPMDFIGLYCEDDRNEIHRRLDAIRRSSLYDFEAKNTHSFKAWCRAGKDNALVKGDGNDIKAGGFMPKLVSYLDTLDKAKPKFMVLDTLSDIYVGDENVREKVNRFIKVYVQKLALDYNITIMFLAHPSRAGQNSGDILSGSTAWHNSVRVRIALIINEDGTRTLTKMKSNYSSIDDNIVLRWEKGLYVPIGVPSSYADRADLLAKYVCSISGGGDQVGINNTFIDELSLDPEYGVLVIGLSSEKRKMDRVLGLLKSDLPNVGDKKVSYSRREDRRPKHWAIIDQL